MSIELRPERKRGGTGIVAGAVVALICVGTMAWYLPRTPRQVVRTNSGVARSDVGTLAFTHALNAANDRLLTTSRALRAYKRDHRAYPSTLSQLVPHYLHAVPLDPFTASSPLAYRRTCDVYALYSVGPDRHDDKGVAIFDPKAALDRAHVVLKNSKGDIVAGLNR